MILLKKIKHYLIKKSAKILINGILFTCRIKIRGKDIIEKNKNSSLIFVFWHRYIFFVIYKFKKMNARPLISLSTDGELVSKIALEFGMHPIRGSSSKGGARAFLELLGTIKKNTNYPILITADGPKGPLRQIKDGTILLAQKSGAKIIPMAWYGSRVKILKKTWDKFMIPLPFSELTFFFGEPLIVPLKINPPLLADLKKKLKDKIDSLEKMGKRIYNK